MISLKIKIWIFLSLLTLLPMQTLTATTSNPIDASTADSTEATTFPFDIETTASVTATTTTSGTTINPTTISTTAATPLSPGDESIVTLRSNASTPLNSQSFAKALAETYSYLMETLATGSRRRRDLAVSFVDSVLNITYSVVVTSIDDKDVKFYVKEDDTVADSTLIPNAAFVANLLQQNADLLQNFLVNNSIITTNVVLAVQGPCTGKINFLALNMTLLELKSQEEALEIAKSNNFTLQLATGLSYVQSVSESTISSCSSPAINCMYTICGIALDSCNVVITFLPVEGNEPIPIGPEIMGECDLMGETDFQIYAFALRGFITRTTYYFPDASVSTATPDPATATPDPATATPDPTIATLDPATATPDLATATPNPAIAITDPATAITDPATATLDPAAATPDPATATPDPATATLNPATATPDPATATPDPATATPDPATATLNPATATLDPATAITDPATAITDPATATLDPATATPYSATTTPDPATATLNPATATLNPATATPDSATATSDPATATPDPATATLNPATATLDPATATPDPATATPDPATATLNPATATLNPATATLDPATATPDPATATLDPTTATLNPATATLDPATVTLDPATAFTEVTTETCANVCPSVCVPVEVPTWMLIVVIVLGVLCVILFILLVYCIIRLRDMHGIYNVQRKSKPDNVEPSILPGNPSSETEFHDVRRVQTEPLAERSEMVPESSSAQPTNKSDQLNNLPPVGRPPVLVEDFTEAQKSIDKALDLHHPSLFDHLPGYFPTRDDIGSPNSPNQSVFSSQLPMPERPYDDTRTRIQALLDDAYSWAPSNVGKSTFDPTPNTVHLPNGLEEPSGFSMPATHGRNSVPHHSRFPQSSHRFSPQ